MGIDGWPVVLPPPASSGAATSPRMATRSYQLGSGGSVTRRLPARADIRRFTARRPIRRNPARAGPCATIGAISPLRGNDGAEEEFGRAVGSLVAGSGTRALDP